jgi:hypothetical protein
MSRIRLVGYGLTTVLITSALGGALAMPMAQASPGYGSLPLADAPGVTVPSGAEGVRRSQKIAVLKDDLCAKAVPLGLVRFAGPGGVRLVARVRSSGDARLLTIVSGSGRIGGVAVRPKDVSGELTWRKSTMTGSVTIDLPDHVKVSRTWAQQVRVQAQPNGCTWSGAVVLQAQGVGASLDLRGPLSADGTYQLRGSGLVLIGKTRVPVTGVLRSPGSPGFDSVSGRTVRSRETTWRISGDARGDVRLPGARVQGVRLTMSETVRLVVGTGTVRLDAPLLTAPARMEVSGADSWTARVSGSNRRVWAMPKTDLMVRTGTVAGTIGMRKGVPAWNLSAPGETTIDEINYVVQVGFTGPFTYTAQAKAGVGTILGLPGSRPFIGVPTKLTITPKGMTGAMTVVTRGELLLPLADSWTARTAYAVVPVPGQGWSFTAGLTHTMSAGKGAIRLTGPVVDNGVDLVASGAMEVSGTLVPVRGYYQRTSFVDGSTPVWALAADVDKAPGGRIPLDGGAGMVGGIFVFDGPGAQPISMIPASSSKTPAGVSPRASDVPSAPTSVVATVSGGTSVTVSWAAANGNGAAVTDYQVSTTSGVRVCNNVTTLSCTFPANVLPPSTYAFKVQAMNSVGWGNWSAPSASVIIGNPAPSPTPTPTPTPEPSTEVTVSGNSTVQLSDSDDDTFLLPITYSYADPNNWTATVNASTPSNVYNPYTGLEIPETDFSGTVTDTDGTQTWNVSIAMQDWQDFAVGVDLQGAFTISNTCPLESDDCPSEDSGIYIGGQSSLLFESTSIPTIYAFGAFTTDLTWARWDATVTQDITFVATDSSGGGIEIDLSDSDVTVWKGERNDTNPNVVLPDLSSLNPNEMGLEFCSEFVVAVPDIDTVSADGCVEWGGSATDVVIAQVGTGGNVATPCYNDICLPSITLTGYAWNGIDSEQTIFLNGDEIVMQTGENYLTGDIIVPGSYMSDFGTGTSADTTISATGWFDEAGDFALDAAIPVNLSGSGFTLQEITVSIGKSGEDFTLMLDAECSVVIGGNHFPLDVYIGFESSDAETITVGLTATGTQSTSSEGTMDFVTLIPTGNFEPTNASLINGSFDGALPPNIPTDGGFERSSTPGNLVVNSDFESGMGISALTNGDFEDGSAGNILANGDFESTELLVNGDFEQNGGSLLGWQTSSTSFTASTALGTATGAENQGSYMATLANNAVGTTKSLGLTQTIPLPLNQYGISVTAWVTSTTSTSAPFHITLVGNGCSSTTSTQGATVTATTTTWVEASASLTMGSGCDSITVTLVPENSGTSVGIDAVEFAITSTDGTATLPTVWRPNVIATFDSLSSTPFMSGYSSGLAVNSTEPGTLQANNTDYWMTYSNTTGYTPGDFDVSYKLYFQGGDGNNSQNANFGFWLDGNYSTMTGYCFALHTNDGNGGFYKNCKSNSTKLKTIGKVDRGTWFEVRLTAVDGTVTAYVTEADSNELVTTASIDVTTPPGGIFGQVPSGKDQDNGFLWDDLTIFSLADADGQQATAYAPNQVKWGDGLAHSGEGYVALAANGVSGAPFEYSTGETPTQGATYTYSTWMRASSGTVSGTMAIAAMGGAADESVSKTFSVGTKWTQTAVTMTVQDDDHADLRPKLTITSTGGGQLYLDDQILQEVPWAPTGSTTAIQVTDDDAYSGTQSMSLPSYSQGSQALYTFAQPPAAGSVATLTAWVKTPGNAVSADLRIGEQAGDSLTRVTVNSTWQQVTVTRTMKGGTSDMYVGLTVDGGQASPIYIDDVTLTVTGTNSTQTDEVGAPLPPTGWMTDSDDTAVVSSGPVLARDGDGALMIASVAGPSNALNLNQVVTYVTDDTPSVGSTWNANLWVKGTSSGSYATVELSSGVNSVTTNVEMTTGYQQVQLSLPMASSTGPLQITISNTDTSGIKTVYVDDVSIVELGLTPVDDWASTSASGFVSIIAVDNAAAAYDGDNYLSLLNSSSSSSTVYLDDDSYTAVSGTAHEMSFWAIAPQGDVNSQAKLTTYDVNGNPLDTYSVAFTATNTWQFVYLSLPLKNTGATSIRSQISLPAGAMLALDDVESRDVASWSAAPPAGGTGTSFLTIIDGVMDAVNGMNYLRFTTTAAGGGILSSITTDTDGGAVSVSAGSSYELSAYVRSTTGVTESGSMSLSTSAGDVVSVPFTATGDWSQVQVTLTTTQAATSLTPKITLGSGGQLDVDELTVVPILIEQSDPWSPLGSGVSWQVVDDPTNAHDSSYGLMKFTASNPGTGVQHAVDQSTNVGDVFSVNAWVRSSTATDIQGSVQVTTVGGTNEMWKQSFTADQTWQSVSIPMTIAQSGHTSLNVAVLSNTPGVMLYVDDVTMQQNEWIASGPAVTQTIVYDGGSAQSGTSYMELSYTGSGSGSTYYDMAASDDIGGVYAAGTTWIVTAYIKSSSATALTTGQLGLGDPTGSPTLQGFSVGQEWTAVTASYTVGSSDLSALRVQIFASGSSAPVDVDSISISDGTPAPDGITTPLPHPDSGYIYLWDEAFGIPGAHLWAASAQVDVVDGVPGLGVSATLYQDPTKMSSVMTGTDWIKGDMAINFSEADPCFLFDFATTGDSGVSLGQGVFTANDFSISFAALGCQVGSYTVMQGAALSFDGELGDGSLTFDISITEDDDGPVFSTDMGITDITVGGVDFKDMELSIYESTTDDSITFIGDMLIDSGTFDATLDLTANETELLLDGSVSLSDWVWAGGGFDMEEFNFAMSMDVPFGEGECGSFSSDTSGLMDMAAKTSLSFTGDIAVDCGVLKTLHIEYDYQHSAITYIFDLDYSSDTGILAGGMEFTFNRSTSWNFWFHKFNRHPYFDISLAYSMNVDSPASTLEATLSGTVSVSGGSGSVSCTINAGSGTNWADDECSLDVTVTAGGGHEYKATW